MTRPQSKCTKAESLVELVKGKTLLREAPTRRDVFLALYGLDIDGPDPHDNRCGCQRYSSRLKLTALLRSLRNREYDRIVNYSLHEYNGFHTI
jgi:hypothetical protein